MANEYFEMDEFLDFFFSVYGENPEIKCKDEKPDISIKPSITSSTLVDKVYNSLKKHSSQIDQTVVATQKINIICGGKNIKVDPMFLEYRGHEYTITGNKKEGTGCVNGGCCPTVHQRAKIKLAAIQKTVLDETVEMVNKIYDFVKQKTEVKVGCVKTKKPKVMAPEIKKEALNATYKRVREMIEKETNIDYSADQTINIHMKSPLLCMNKCNEEPSSSLITQEINLRVLATNIIDVVKKSIDDTTIESYTESKTSFSADSPVDDSLKSYTYAILTVILTMLIYGLFVVLAHYVLLFIAFRFLRQDMLNTEVSDVFPKYVLHLTAIIIMYILAKIWKILVCMYKKISGGDIFGIISCIFGDDWWNDVLNWIKCLVKKIIKWIIETIFSIPPLNLLKPLIEAAMGVLGGVTKVIEGGIAGIGAIFQGKDPFKAFSKKFKEKDPCATDEEILLAFEKELEEIMKKNDRSCKARNSRS
jgi:hypothetical protein